jgi:hypothetical protein
MSLSEYRSPVIKKPKFGWQRYQFGNKSAAELKLSLWDANLSEVVVENTGTVPTFPITKHVDVGLLHDTNNPTYGTSKHFSGKMLLVTPINNLNELVQYLNKRDPFLGEFRPTSDQLNVQLVVDKTWSRITNNNDGFTWNFELNIIN